MPCWNWFIEIWWEFVFGIGCVEVKERIRILLFWNLNLYTFYACGFTLKSIHLYVNGLNGSFKILQAVCSCLIRINSSQHGLMGLWWIAYQQFDHFKTNAPAVGPLIYTRISIEENDILNQKCIQNINNWGTWILNW